MPRTSKSQPSGPTGPRLVRRTTVKPPVQPDVTHEQIAARAYEIFEQEGSMHGNHVDHWLKAESELRGLVTVQPPKRIAATRARR